MTLLPAASLLLLSFVELMLPKHASLNCMQGANTQHQDYYCACYRYYGEPSCDPVPATTLFESCCKRALHRLVARSLFREHKFPVIVSHGGNTISAIIRNSTV